MAKFDFNSPSSEHENELLIECERQLRPLIDDIVQSAVKAGWREEDILLSLADLSWSMFDERRKASPASV